MRSSFRIRRFARNEAALLRDLRVRSIEDAPDAFAPTIQEVRSEPDSYWEALCASIVGSPDQEVFLAFSENEACGVAYGRVDGELRESAHLGGMWVAPRARGCQLGSRLASQVLAWATSVGCRRVVLWVTQANAPAIALYERLGFTPTGRTDALREGSELTIIEMERLGRESAA